ncbi:acetolactate decarboxylase [Sphingobacterium sp. SRCM116780]|uniref:acetolactate decarboxylase n=1 Tax=Sphingobacterium sp. SRCM116780 TaxID=2907623 RepID=UPI001F2CA90F|nr:acetolactate decarboxylase [Sphingobacterium sp. SRCM116780]UIR57885.1 acetolactate decarboxylase [Sphingobacterium sp. SRCM116780]
MKLRNMLIAAFICISLNSFSQQVINGFAMPESVTSDGKRFFVSNQGQDFSSRDSDGFISEISADGKLVELKFAPIESVLHAPKGMAIEHNILYVADLERVLGFDINTRKTVFELSIPKAIMLNDICLLENGFIGITDTYSGNIYKVNTRTKSFEIIGNIPTINGISFNKNTNQLAVCTNGKTLGEGAVYIKTGNEDFRQLPNISNGFFDGIVWIDDSRLLLSDWVTFPTKGYGKLWFYDLKNQQAEMLLTEESIADIYYDSATQKIYMPQMQKNKVIITDKKELETVNKEKYNRLYQYGIADAFVGGLYRGTLPLKDLKLKGDFGLGAPDMLDGELTILDGKVYQTKATGETVEPENDFKTSMSFVTFFKADTVFNVENAVGEKALWEQISEVLKNKNAMYAIKITGKFDHIKTRAFPSVKNEPFPVITTIFDTQKFFEFSDTQGILVGYHLPEYLNGINSKGFHYHFLSSNKTQGGHVLDFTARNLTIEIAEMKSFELNIPTDKYFQNFKFDTKDNEALKRVEQGK